MSTSRLRTYIAGLFDGPVDVVSREGLKHLCPACRDDRRQSMLSDAAARALRDMAYHIDLAASFATAMDFETFRDDLRTVYAVTRCLEIISEASRRLPDDLKARHPTIAWKEMAGAGNIYRHDYEDVAASLCMGYYSATICRQLRAGNRAGTCSP